MPKTAFAALPRPIAGIKGPTSKNRSGNGRGGEGKEGAGGERGRRKERFIPVYFFFATSSPGAQ